MPVNREEVKQCLQKLNPRKAIGWDKIPPALIQMAAESLSTPLSILICADKNGGRIEGKLRE